jgi:hypothetical protein
MDVIELDKRLMKNLNELEKTINQYEKSYETLDSGHYYELSLDRHKYKTLLNYYDELGSISI